MQLSASQPCIGAVWVEGGNQDQRDLHRLSEIITLETRNREAVKEQTLIMPETKEQAQCAMALKVEFPREVGFGRW
jgi:hypothetical protein